MISGWRLIASEAWLLYKSDFHYSNSVEKFEDG